MFCWTRVSGYMGACWRTLAARPGVSLLVTAEPPNPKAPSAFTQNAMAGVPTTYIAKEDLDSKLLGVARDFKPDLVVLCGWATPAFRALTKARELSGCRFVMAMDTPYRGTLRQNVGGWVMRGYFSRIDRVLVAGERTFRLARQLGFSEHRIRRGMYGIDFDHFGSAIPARMAKGWPRRFIFMGRYHRDKAIDTLVRAFDAYASSVPDPWELWTCGQGPLASMLQGRKHVIDLGFVQPEHQPDRFAMAGCFVLPSRYEPWGAVIAEACAAGLPVICSESCGASVDLVHHLFNGFRFSTDDVHHLTAAFRWMHAQRADSLRLMGERSRAFAEPYGTECWANGVQHLTAELLSPG